MRDILIDGIHTYKDSKEIILRITKKCNQKCLFCLTDIDNYTVIPFDLIKREIDFLISLYGKNFKLDFVISGGEPTIHPDFIRIVKYLFKKDVSITVQTNGVFFSNKSNIDKIFNYLNKIYFIISFHSHNKKIYDIITGSSGQFELAVEGILNLLKFNKFKILNLNLVINSFNIKFIKEYFLFTGKTFFKVNGNFKINISVLTNINKYSYGSKLLVKYTDIVNGINNSKKIIEKYNIRILENSFGGPCNLPFCIAKNLFFYKPIVFFEKEKFIDKVSLDQCNKCKFKYNCNGILDLYLDKYGNSEFIPIK